MKIIVTIVVAIIVFNTSKSEAQKVFINADKNIYKSNDTIKLKIINKSLTDLVYVVGLVTHLDNCTMSFVPNSYKLTPPTGYYLSCSLPVLLTADFSVTANSQRLHSFSIGVFWTKMTL